MIIDATTTHATIRATTSFKVSKVHATTKAFTLVVFEVLQLLITTTIISTTMFDNYLANILPNLWKHTFVYWFYRFYMFIFHLMISYFMIYIYELASLRVLFIFYLSCVSSCSQHFLWRILLIVLISKSFEVVVCICTFCKIHCPWFSYSLDYRCQLMH